MKIKPILLATAFLTIASTACKNAAGDNNVESQDTIITPEYCFVDTTEQGKKITAQHEAAAKWQLRAQNLLDFMADNSHNIWREYENAIDNAVSNAELTKIRDTANKEQQDFYDKYHEQFIEKANKILAGFNKECPDIAQPDALNQIEQVVNMMEEDAGMIFPNNTPEISD